MNSITIATKTTRMEIRLQTAVIQASNTGSNPKAVICETRAGLGEGAPQLVYPTPPPLICTFWDSSELQPAEEQVVFPAGSWRDLGGGGG